MDIKDLTPEERNRIALALGYEADRLNEVAERYKKGSPEFVKYVTLRNETERLEKRFN